MCECSNLKYYKHNFDLPIVFQCENCGKLYMCECQKQYYDIIYYDCVRRLGRKDIQTYITGKTATNEFVDLYELAQFKKNICFICTQSVPPYYNYCDLSVFAHRYYPYIETIVLAHFNGSFFNDTFTAFKVDYSVIKEVMKKAEDEIREKANYPLKSDKWLNEKFLYQICCVIFDKDLVIRQYSPSWLGRLRLDIYIPKYKIGIEYQGKQHYEPVDFFGGKDNFEKQQIRDKEKASLCQKHGIKLIYFNFKENITEDHVIKKIKKYIKIKI